MPTRSTFFDCRCEGIDNRLPVIPQLVQPTDPVVKDIAKNGTTYKAKDKIPPSATKHIEQKHSESSIASLPRGSSYFLSTVDKTTIDRMIIETMQRPREYKIDDKPREGRGAGKMIYRFQEYDREIGKHGARVTPCRWLVVVAKSNGWIKTAYPVPSPFLPSGL